MKYYYTSTKIPGWFHVGILATDYGIRRLTFSSKAEGLKKQIVSDEEKKTKDNIAISEKSSTDFLARAPRQITEYCARQRRSFNLPLDISHYSSFYQMIWVVTMGIPFGAVRSYGWVAQQAGKPGAMRAVGQAMAANPIPLIIPCHRIIRQNGTIGGYSAGLPLKRKFLELEKIKVENNIVLPSNTLSNP